MEKVGSIGTPLHSSHPKVHRSMCSELALMLDKVSSILPSIEAAQPGCKAGIEELCNLYNIVDKGKLIIQNCIECSSLYLAITGEATAMRCERIRSSMRRSLFLIQNMVPSSLANQVADVHNDLHDVKFIVDPEEEEAGKAILEMLRKSDITQEFELQTFLLVCSKLNLTSPKAILIERRAIKKLLDKVSGNDDKKEGILIFFLYLVRKCGKSIKPETAAKSETTNAANETRSTELVANDANTPQKCFTPMNFGTRRYEYQSNLSGVAIPPPDFCCSISGKLMCDPIMIASGQTYERENIERWFSEGYDTCPRTKVKLANFTVTPNTCMKAVICNWCKDQELESTYFPEQFQGYSLSSLHNISVPLIAEKNRDYMTEHSSSSSVLFGASRVLSPMREMEEPKASFTQFYSNANIQLYLSFCNFDKDMFLSFFQDLSELQVELQRKAVKDLRIALNGENQIWNSMVSNGFLEAFLEFLKNEDGRCTVQAQKSGVQFFLTFLRSIRTRIIPFISEDAVHRIASLLDSELKMEALLILQELLQQSSCRKSRLISSVVAPSLIGVMDTADTECTEIAMTMICELFSDNDIKSVLISSGIVEKLSPILNEVNFAECCLKVLRNLCEVTEAADFIIRSDQCLSSISDYLDTGSRKEQEHASVVLLTVCSRSAEDRVLIMKEGVIPALVDLSVNGTGVARASSVRLLQLLRGSRTGHAVDGVVDSSPNGSICKQTVSMSARYISRKLNIFSKPRSLTLV